MNRNMMKLSPMLGLVLSAVAAGLAIGALPSLAPAQSSGPIADEAHPCGDDPDCGMTSADDKECCKAEGSDSKQCQTGRCEDT